VDGFRRRRSDSSLSSSKLPLGCVMVYCETGDTLSLLAAAQYLVAVEGQTVDQVDSGDTLSVLAAAQYLVAVEGQTVDQVEQCLAQAGCVTPLVDT